MTLLASSGPLGVAPYYYCSETLAHAATVRELFQQHVAPGARLGIPSHCSSRGNKVLTSGESPFPAANPPKELAPRYLGCYNLLSMRLDWDLEGVRQYLHKLPDGVRTCFAAVRKVPAGYGLYQDEGKLICQPLPPDPVPTEDLVSLLERALIKIFDRNRKVALALSGGLDSAVVLALIRRIGVSPMHLVTLATGFAGYCERELTLNMARQLSGIDVEVIEAHANDFILALPEVIRACETPLFNLHPVSRWLLARELKQRGFDTLLTGDGADQIFTGSEARNYLPIIGAIVRATGMRLESPFLDPEAMAWAAARPVSPNKQILREAMAGYLPVGLSQIPKVPRYAPDLDVSCHWHAPGIAALAQQLQMDVPTWELSGLGMLWTTLGLLDREVRKIQ